MKFCGFYVINTSLWLMKTLTGAFWTKCFHNVIIHTQTKTNTQSEQDIFEILMKGWTKRKSTLGGFGQKGRSTLFLRLNLNLRSSFLLFYQFAHKNQTHPAAFFLSFSLSLSSRAGCSHIHSHTQMSLFDSKQDARSERVTVCVLEKTLTNLKWQGI